MHGCMYSRYSSHLDGWPTCGVLQVRRKIQWCSWLPLLDSEYLQENNIPCFNPTRTSAAEASQDAGVRVQLDHCSVFLYKVRFTVSGCHSSFWRQVSWFCWKLPKHCTNYFLKIIFMFGFPIVLAYYWLFFTNSEAVMLSKWIFELTSYLSNEIYGFQPQFFARIPQSPGDLACLVLWLQCLLFLCIVYSIVKHPQSLLSYPDLTIKLIFRCFPFCSMSLPLYTSESDLYFWCSRIVTISLFLKRNGYPLQSEFDCFLVLHALSWVIPELLILSKMQSLSC